MLQNKVIQASFEDYNPLDLQPQILTIFVVLFILAAVGITYYFKNRKLRADEPPRGIVLLVEIFVGFVRNLVIDVLGYKFEKMTPYFVYLFAYLLLSNVIGIIGLENPTTSLTVTLSLGMVTFIGTFVVGFKYQKLSYLKIFAINIKVKGKSYPVFINPLEVISAFTPLISISFRLWGNIFAGSMIVSLWFFFTQYLMTQVPMIGVINILGGLTIIPIHAYFDLLCGVIQALVFTLLTMVYWTLASNSHDSEQHQEVKEIKVEPIKGNPNIIRK